MTKWTSKYQLSAIYDYMHIQESRGVFSVSDMEQIREVFSTVTKHSGIINDGFSSLAKAITKQAAFQMRNKIIDLHPELKDDIELYLADLNEPRQRDI